MTADPGLLAATAVAAVAAFTDWRTGHIPNWLTLGGLLVGTALGAIAGAAIHGAGGLLLGLLHASIGAAVTGVVPGLLFAAGGIGGGDVKLLAAIGAACGASVGIEIELYAFVAAALVVGARLAVQGRLLVALRATLGLAVGLLRPRRRPGPTLGELRFGPSVAAACLLVAAARWSSAP